MKEIIFTIKKYKVCTNCGYSFIKYGSEYIKFCNYIWNMHNHNDKIIKGGDFLIHHKDGNKLNDNISNLQKMTRAEHKTLHNKGNKYFLGHSHSKETKNKMSESGKGRKFSIEHRRNISKSWDYNKHFTEETRKKISDSLIGNKRCLGKPSSKETRVKLSQSAKKYWDWKRGL